MKIILLKDVPKVGRKYEIKNIADGFARNMLFPKGLAEVATPDAVRRIEKIKAADTSRVAAAEGELLAQLERLADVTFQIERKANTEGHLFAGLKQEEVLDVVHKKGFSFTANHLNLEKPIKTVGKREVEVAVGNKKGVLLLEVKAA